MAIPARYPQIQGLAVLGSAWQPFSLIGMEQTSLTDLELPEVPDLSPREKFAILRAYLRACREGGFRATDTVVSRVVIGDAGIVHPAIQSSGNSS